LRTRHALIRDSIRANTLINKKKTVVIIN